MSNTCYNAKMSLLPKPSQTLWIHPNRHAQSQAWKNQSRVLDGQTTFDALFTQLGTQRNWQFIDSIRASLVIRHLLQTSTAAYHEHFDATARQIIGIRAITRSILELRAAGITAEHLATQKNAPTSLALCALLADYAEFLAQRRWYDTADRQRQAVYLAVTNGLSASWSHIRHIRVLSGTEILGARLDLLNALAKRGLDVVIQLPWDPLRPDAFAWTDAMLHAIETRGHPSLVIEQDPRIGTGPLQELRQTLYTQRKLSTDAIRVMPAGRGQEHVARCIQTISSWFEQGVGADQIAIVLADPDGLRTKADAATFQHALTQAGIYNHCTHTQNLWQSALARALVNWLRMAPRIQTGLTRTEWMRFWRFWGHHIQTSTASYSVQQIAACFAEISIPRFALEDLPTVLPKVLKNSFSITTDQVASILNAIQERLQILTTVPKKVALRTVLETTQLFWNKLDSNFLQSQDTESIQRIIQSWHKQFLEIDSNAICDLNDVADWWISIFEQTPVHQTQDKSGAIQILTPDTIVGSTYSHVLFVGANHGVFPRPAPFDPILTDSIRQNINASVGPKLLQYTASSTRGALAAQARDTWLAMEILFSCQQNLCLSIVLQGNDDEMAQSEWVELLQRHIDIQIPTTSPSYTIPSQATNAGLLRYAVHQKASKIDLPQYLQPRFSQINARIMHANACQKITSQSLATEVQTGIRQKLSNEVQNASQLDILGQCTYKFFAKYALQLSQPNTNTINWTPAQRGSMTHAALHAVYEALQKHGGLAFARKDPIRAKSILRQAFSIHIQKQKHQFFGHPYLQDGIQAKMWEAIEIQFQRDMIRNDTEILALEFHFGGKYDKSPILSLDLPQSHLHLQIRGIIDRVEYNPKTHTLETFDYKSFVGKRSPQRHFQLGVYALAANQSFAQEPYSLSTAWLPLWDNKIISAPVTDSQTENLNPDAFRDIVTHNLDLRFESLLNGKIDRDVENSDDCKKCDVLRVCRFGYQNTATPIEDENQFNTQDGQNGA